jgi:hypothetical protein
MSIEVFMDDKAFNHILICHNILLIASIHKPNTNKYRFKHQNRTHTDV